MKHIIGIGAAAGALAGMAAFAYSRIQVAPLIAQAIDYEEQRSHALAEITGEHSHGHELYTRAVQENLGAGVGVIGFGMVVGVLFAVAYAVLSTRQHLRSARWTATALSVGGFVAASLVPFIVYPGSPPGVGQEETSGPRTAAFLAVLVASLAAAALMAAVAMHFAPKVGTWPSAMAAAWSYVGVIVIAATLLPEFDEVPGELAGAGGAMLFPGFPADLLYEFRLHSLLTAAVMWMVLGTGFAAAVSRVQPAGATMAGVEVVHGRR